MEKLLRYWAVILMIAFMIVSSVPVSAGLKDGEYSIDVSVEGGSGKAYVQSPTLLIVDHESCFVQLTWSSSNYDYMLVDGVRFENESAEGVNSSFTIPVDLKSEESAVIADTIAMGTPHEIEYQLRLYSDSIGAKSALPQEGAKRVLIMAAVIIIVGGIFNHFVQKRRNEDFKGTKRRG